MEEASLLSRSEFKNKLNRFKELLVSKRKSLNLSQNKFAEICRINSERYKRFEMGYGVDKKTAYKMSMEEIVKILDELKLLDSIFYSSDLDTLTKEFLSTSTGKQWAKKAAVEYYRENYEAEIEKYERAISEIKKRVEKLNSDTSLF